MLLTVATLAGCTETGAGVTTPIAAPTASFMTDELVQVQVEFDGTPETDAVRSITDCAVAEAVELRGGSFARHVRTTISEEAGISRADAIYTVSPTLPAGRFVIDAEAVAFACREQDYLRG